MRWLRTEASTQLWAAEGGGEGGDAGGGAGGEGGSGKSGGLSGGHRIAASLLHTILSKLELKSRTSGRSYGAQVSLYLLLIPSLSTRSPPPLVRRRT